MSTLRNLVCLAALVVANAGAAQSYPDGNVRIIVPYPAGGPTDVVARLVGQKLSEALGRQFYVEDHGGASGTIGTALVAAAPADGRTILFSTPDFLIQPIVKAKPPYNAIKDFAPIVLLASAPEVIAVNPSVPAKTLQELVALLKANPGKYQYASPGVGSTPHLEGEWIFKITYGLDVIHVPFQGAAPAVTSTIAGHTSIINTTLAAIAPQIKDGRLRALAVIGDRRSPTIPDVPTLREADLPGVKDEFYLVAAAPAGTRKEIVALLNAQIGKILQQPDVKDALTALGYEPAGGSPEDLAAKIAGETEKWRKVVAAANIRID